MKATEETFKVERKGPALDKPQYRRIDWIETAETSAYTSINQSTELVYTDLARTVLLYCSLATDRLKFELEVQLKNKLGVIDGRPRIERQKKCAFLLL